MTWNEVIRKLRKHGFVLDRKGHGSHQRWINHETGKEVWVSVHGTQESGHLGYRILREAGIKV